MRVFTGAGKTTLVGLVTVFVVSGCAATTNSEVPTTGSATSVMADTSSMASMTSMGSSGDDQSVTLTAAESMVPFEGTQRWAMTYNGAASGPTIRVHPGDRFSITLVNDLTQATSLHTHGLHVSPDQDNPFTVVEPGQSRTYTYDVPEDQQAGTYWYHPHTHGSTAEQVASGLSGAIIVEDATDQELSKVSTDRVLVLNDPPLVTENPWSPREASGHMMDGHSMDGHMMDGAAGMNNSSGVDMMTAMLGRTGPAILTNGQRGVQLEGSDGKLERVHVVNATASTRMLLQYDGKQMIQLAEAGGRLPNPVVVSAVELAPGERTELVLVPGAQGGHLTAQRLSNEGSGGPIGQPEIVASVAKDAGRDVTALPSTLQANTRDLFADDVQIAKRRVISLVGHMNPTIDGKPFDPNTVNFTAKKGTVEEWEIRNESPMLHPIHLHTWPFQVKGEPGWQDIVTVPANSERVIRVAFDDFAGTTVIHCHVLDHEDSGMMAVIRVA